MTEAQRPHGIRIAELAAAWAKPHGAPQSAFAGRVPEVLFALAARWHLTIGDPVGMGYESLAVGATDHAGREMVVKLSPPGPRVLAEARAYRALSGPGMARLVDARPDDGALLLLRIRPGTPLKEEPDDERAADAFAGVLGAGLGGGPGQWRDFPRLEGQQQLGTLEPWAKHLTAVTPPTTAATADMARQIAARLWSTSPVPCLMHGDLHDQNILHAGGGRFLAIDPKGVVGDPAYEPACFLMNRWTRDGAKQNPESMVRYAEGVARRVALDPRRVVGWAFVHTAVSLAWSWESGDLIDALPGPDPRWLVLDALGRAIGFPGRSR